MYLREMGSVELLSREGEIAIAKRIEAGREAMIAGLCESPLTFQAIIVWRDELNDGRDSAARHHRPRGDLCGPDGQARHPSTAGRRHALESCAEAEPAASRDADTPATDGEERGRVR
jgi:RNA polymerase primary sigma factor